MYILIKPGTMGRDRFESFCNETGHKLKVKRNPVITTDSRGTTHFDNHLLDLELTAVNQAWVSDITYYRIKEDVYYLTFIMDLFSRRIVGHKASKRLLTSLTTLPALKMAISTRKNIDLEGLILHSDGGGQYYATELLNMTRKKKIINSMAKSVYENPHAERINGTIKNEYLSGYQPLNFDQLTKLLTKAVKMYNMHRPHNSLNKLNPNAFEISMAA
jgi:transposase InsO family protein